MEKTIGPALPLIGKLNGDRVKDDFTFSMKQHTRSLILLICAIIFGLGLVELLIRLYVGILSGEAGVIFQATVVNQDIERKDDYRNHALIENKAFTTTGRPPGFEYCTFGKISSQGLNNDEIPLVKPEGEKRILILGDSFVEARQVSRDRNFCEILEKRLFRERGGGIRVINAGITTYSPILEYLFLKKELARFKPDLVILMFFANDVFDDLRYAMNARYDEDNHPLAVDPDAPWLAIPGGEGDAAVQSRSDYIAAAWHERPRTALTRRFYLAAWIDHILAYYKLRKQFPTPPRNDEFFILGDDPAREPAREKGWALTKQHIKLIREESGVLGAKLMIACVPIAAQVYGRSSYDHFFFRGKPTDADQRNIRRICAGMDVAYIDIFEPLARAGQGLYYPNDGHWTPKGHRVGAEALYDALSDKIGEEK